MAYIIRGPFFIFAKKGGDLRLCLMNRADVVINQYNINQYN